jgi:hypothetical protein
VVIMSAPLKILTLALAAAVAAVNVADAAPKKKRAKVAPTADITRDYDGTPIIMQGYRVPRVTQDAQPQTSAADRAKQNFVLRPYGSSGPAAPPSAGLVNPPPLVQPPGVHQPPPINSFGDRVTNCIHSFPLNRGLGNNPTDQQAYIRQCAN